MDYIKVEESTYLQVSMMLYLMDRWGKTKEEFFEVNKKYEVLKFIRQECDFLHLMGEEGIAEEVEDFIYRQGGSRGWQ